MPEELDMASIDELAEKYASMIREAVREDRRTKTAADLREGKITPATMRVAAVLRDVGKRIDGLVYEDEKPASDAAKEAVADEVAEKLGLDKRKLRRTLKEASVQHFLAILTDIREVVQRVK